MAPPRPSIAIAHPERQHSHQMAAGLDARGMLGIYIHGAALPRYSHGDISERLRYRNLWFQPVRRGISRALPAGAAHSFVIGLLGTYDRWLARQLRGLGCDAIVAFEMSALSTFEAAKRQGIACILDAASLHHSVQVRWLPDSNTAATIALKDREIELADMIITCSSLARNSYIAAGVPHSKLFSVPLGVDTTAFDIRGGVGPETGESTRPVTFCSAGPLDRKKGLDLIVAASRELRTRGGIDFRVNIAGNRFGADPALIRDIEAVAALQDRVPHEELPCFLGEADVFLLPSRLDSFGMIVSEALSCGVPVIVSENVGSKELVSEGENGWIVPTGDAGALAERMAWCASNPAAVRAMTPAARASALRRSWADYRRDVADAIEAFMAEWQRNRPRPTATGR